MWPRRAIGVAGGGDQRPAERFRRKADVEEDHFRGDPAGRGPAEAAVERAVDGYDIGGKVIPGHCERAVGAHERHGADGSSRSAGVVGAVRDKARSMVRGVSDADAAGARSAERRVPGDVDPPWNENSVRSGQRWPPSPERATVNSVPLMPPKLALKKTVMKL